MQQVDHITLEALVEHVSCKVWRLVGRCKPKDNKQSRLRQIQQAFADVDSDEIVCKAHGQAALVKQQVTVISHES